MQNDSIHFWRGKRVLLTGHTGFKGGWMALCLQRWGAQVTGLALSPCTQPNLFELAQIGKGMDSHFQDIRDAQGVLKRVCDSRAEIVLHLAAQPLVRASYAQPIETFATNVMGTAHVLQALRALPDVKVAVVITTDKVYRNLEHSYPYREDDALGGHDPYSASKAACELVTASYRDSFLKTQGVAVATARAGNVIGGGDWSQDRLLPDAARAWESGAVLKIRNPQSTRPWQHVLEPVMGYLRLAECLWHQPALAGAYNLGPQTHEAATVQQVIELAQQAYGQGEWVSEPDPNAVHEAGWLALEIAKARTLLNVHPCWDLKESVQRTMHWYRQCAQGQDARKLCEDDLHAFEDANALHRTPA
jgi:CDP-glucose 4,6-dehydratase